MTEKELTINNELVEITRHTQAVPISKVFLESGHSVLESEAGKLPADFSGAKVPGSSFSRLGRAVTLEPEWSFVTDGGRLLARETLVGSSFDPSQTVLREQVGSDFLRWSDRFGQLWPSDKLESCCSCWLWGCGHRVSDVHHIHGAV